MILNLEISNTFFPPITTPRPILSLLCIFFNCTANQQVRRGNVM